MSGYFHNRDLNQHTLLSLCPFAFQLFPNLTTCLAWSLMDSFPTSTAASSCSEQVSDRQRNSSWKEPLTCDFMETQKHSQKRVFLQLKAWVFWQMEEATAMWNISKAFLLTEEWAVSAVFKQSHRLLKLIMSIFLICIQYFVLYYSYMVNIIYLTSVSVYKCKFVQENYIL